MASGGGANGGAAAGADGGSASAAAATDAGTKPAVGSVESGAEKKAATAIGKERAGKAPVGDAAGRAVPAESSANSWGFGPAAHGKKRRSTNVEPQPAGSARPPATAPEQPPPPPPDPVIRPAEQIPAKKYFDPSVAPILE